MSSVAKLTDAEEAVLSVLDGGDEWGCKIREQLKKQKIRQSIPAFYSMMARLEAAGYVRGWFEARVAANTPIKQRRYSLTPEGHRAIKEVQEID